MQTVIQVSLSGHSKAFHLEEDAYRALQAYLDRARSRLKRDPDYDEVLRDLEQSIGEKLGQSLRPENRVISRKEIDVVLDEVGAVNAGNGDTADTAQFGVAPAVESKRANGFRRLQGRRPIPGIP
jgi:hypothetical protein